MGLAIAAIMDINKNRNNIVNEISSRLQLLITIGIIFPTLTYGFFRIVGQSETFSSSSSFTWWILIVLFLFNYLLFETLKAKLSTKFLVWFSRLYLAEIGVFIFPISVFSSKSNEALSFLAGISFFASMLALVIIPFILGIVLMIQFFRYFVFST